MKHTELKMKNLRWETVILKINIENETGYVLKGKNTKYENNSRNIDVSLPDYLSLKSTKKFKYWCKSYMQEIVYLKWMIYLQY
jgi:P pilus assembly chaperone PapD